MSVSVTTNVDVSMNGDFCFFSSHSRRGSVPDRSYACAVKALEGPRMDWKVT